MKGTSCLTLWLAVLLGTWSSAAMKAEPAEDGTAEVTRWLVVQPGYPGSTDDAEGFMRLFSAYIAKKTDLGELLGAYHNTPEEALAAFRAGRPAFSLVSLGFYLQYRKQLGLAPLLESKPQDRFVIVAPEGTLSGPAALDGKKVGGGPLYESEFLKRVVFRGKAPVATWKGEAVLRTTRALRRLDRGTYAAVVLTGRELAVLGTLSRRKKLEKVLESAYYPQSLLVYSTGRREEKKSVRTEDGRSAGESPVAQESQKTQKRSQARAERAGGLGLAGRDVVPPAGPVPAAARGELSVEQRRRLEQAFLSLADDAEGLTLLKTMGIRGFVTVRIEWLKRMEGIFDAESK